MLGGALITRPGLLPDRAVDHGRPPQSARLVRRGACGLGQLQGASVGRRHQTCRGLEDLENGQGTSPQAYDHAAFHALAQIVRARRSSRPRVGHI
jgi:hypothetical protein